MRAPRAGFTLVELTVSTAILSIILGTFVVVCYQTTSARKATEDNFVLELNLLNALNEIRSDLQRSGNIGGVFPQIFDAETIGDEYPEFTHDPVHAHEDGDRTNRDIAFLLPALQDGWPEYDANGSAVWEADPVGYVLVPDSHGTNTLRRVVDGQSTDIAQRVVRAIFDTSATSGFAIPLDCVRLQLELAAVEGGEVRSSVAREIVVRLRNSDD